MSKHEQTRVVARMGAQELSPEEVASITAAGVPCRITFTHLPGGGSDEDTQCP